MHSVTQESLLDMLLPLSLFALLLQRSSDPLGMVLLIVIWLAFKLFLRTKTSPIYWCLIGVIAISLAMMTHSVPNSSPSDLLLTLLAFTAGAGRSREQWHVSFWILAFTGVVAFLIFELDHGRSNGNLEMIPLQSLRDFLPDYALRLRKITINRSGYILGIVSILGFGLARHDGGSWRRWLALGLGLLSYGMAFSTGSRAATVFPLFALLLAEIAWRCRIHLSRLAKPIAFLVVLIGLIFNLSIYHPSSPFAYANPNETGRANVAQCFISQATQSGIGFFTGQGGDQVSSICRRITPPNPNSKKGTTGPPHAHNAFLQTLADYGLPAALMLVVIVGLSLRNALQMIAAGEGLQGTLALSLGLFIFGSALVESTLLTTSLQQVLSGYLLAVAWPGMGKQNECTLQPAVVGSPAETD